jgi:type IV/VI secretion system ImpK/VasF family protein
MGSEPSMERFKRDIESSLARAEREASADPALAHLYARIERPLVFFIDYMVMEGNFPFRNEWQELARKYNELSGDEKFFDILSESLDNPDAAGILPVFYLMLGLGFDGSHHGDPDYISQCMRRCEEKISGSFNIRSERLVTISLKKQYPLYKKKRFFSAPLVLVLAIVFMFIGFSVNLTSFLKNTENYRKSLSDSVRSAVSLSNTVFYEIPGQTDAGSTLETGSN